MAALPVFLLVLVALVRCWNMGGVFVDGKTFFVDADCYSRMTRVQRVLEQPGAVVHRHDFENWPEGTQPHTTAPLDYLVAGLAGGARLFARDARAALDFAGAWISPLLGVLTGAFLWFWAGRRPFRAAMLLLFAVSPILVHGTVLGRPDHQSLILLCMALALGAEAVLLERPSRQWALAGGLAWGAGLWVSLYEPLILLLCAWGAGGALRRKAFFARERWVEAAAMVGVLACAVAVDGWQIALPDPLVRAYFPNWSRTVGELAHRSFPELLRWTGWLLPLAPAGWAWAGWRSRDRAAWFWLVLTLALAGLTCWQARWGYFLALVFAMGLPGALAALPRRGWAGALFAVSLWPVAAEWDAQLDPRKAALRAEQRIDNLALYDVAQQLRGAIRLPVLAPWWQSPALSYWSGQPCVAGSSHESLPGIVDVSRFYLSADPEAAEAILARRQVACVVAYAAERVLAVSGAILDEKPPEGSIGQVLYERPHSPPPFLELAYSNAAFRVFLRPEGVRR